MKTRSIILLAIALLVVMYCVGMREGYSQGGLASLNSNVNDIDLKYLTGKNENVMQNETRLNSNKMFS